MAIIKEDYRVEGMSCAVCASSIESMLQSLEGLQNATVNFADSSVWFEYDTDIITLNEISNQIDKIGYKLMLNEDDGIGDQKYHDLLKLRKKRDKTIYSILLSLPVFLISMFFHNIPFGNTIMFVLSIPVVGWFGREFFISAYFQTKNISANMDSLVALGTGSAFLFSTFNFIFPNFLISQGYTPHLYYEAATVIISLVLLGRYIEDKAKSKTTESIKNLLGLQVKTARIIRNDQVIEVPVKDVAVGNIVIIRPGEKIPVDGTIINGSTSVDESMITGESLPVYKTIGNKLIGGTINKNGSIQLEADKVGEQTMLAQIIELVRKAQGSKAPVQKLADKIAKIFVPVVFIIALISGLAWYWIGPETQLTNAFITFITVLIISCPCALGLATPTAIMVGIGKGAKKGILIQHARSLEMAKKIDVIVTDKTGTITEGTPSIIASYFNPNIEDKNHMIQTLIDIESHSEHPLANAIIQNYKDSFTPNSTLQEFQNIPGHGIVVTNAEGIFYVGNRFLLDNFKIPITDDFSNIIQQYTDKKYSTVYFAKNKELIAVFGITDTLKKNSIEAINSLKRMGLETHLLSGDSPIITEHIAKMVGVEVFRGSQSPADKLHYIESLQKKGKNVAMVGDGINDAPALAQADLAIAMGDGTDIAIDNSDITIVRGNLLKIAKSINLSYATVRTIKQNLFWAFIYNIIAIPIAAGLLYPINGFTLNPMIAGGAMAFSSISVVLNSLRLRRKKI